MKEEQYINVLRGTLISLVVVGHFGQTVANLMTGEAKNLFGGIVLMIYLFHMPLFLFVSGYLSRDAEKRRNRAFTDLFLPYLYFQIACGLGLWVMTENNANLVNIFFPVMGGWYLLSLFCFRASLPYLLKVKHLLVISLLLSVFACVLSGLGKEFALRKSFGFFVYFLAGYYMSSKGISLLANRLSKGIAVFLLIMESAFIVVALHYFDIYQITLSLFTRALDITHFSHWYYAPILYLIALVVTSVTAFLVINAIPHSNSILEHLGKDTLPMYLSHLVLFMAMAALCGKSNRLLAILCAGLGIVLSLVVFSCQWYRKLFHGAVNFITALIMQS